MRRKGTGAEEGTTRLAYSTAKETATPATRPATGQVGVRAAGGKGIRLRLESRPGGRVVTVVLGLVGGEADLAAVARTLKSACGTGGTLKDGVVELQGDHRPAAQAALATMGLKAAI